GVARDALVQVLLRFEGVVAGLAGRIAPDLLRGMEAAALPDARRAAHGDAQALVASEAEALLLVAALALHGGHARLDRVHRDEVVRVDRPRAHLAVVAVGAEVLAVAVGAELGVVRGDLAVAEDPVGPVLGVVEPPWRAHLAAGELGPHP